MNRQEHMQEAQDLLKRADEESTDGGNDRIAAEFMWGAFAHCLITVAQNNGLPHDSHGTFRIIAQHMDAAEGSNDWRSRFGSAERLHHHFYHGDLPADELQTHSPAYPGGCPRTPQDIASWRLTTTSKWKTDSDAGHPQMPLSGRRQPADRPRET